MSYSKPILFLLITIALLHFMSLPRVTEASPLILWYYYCINATGSYTDFSMYQENLNVIISGIASSTQTDGFYNVSVGNGADKVNAIGLCRGDLDNDTCLKCLEDAVYKIPSKCPTQKEAIGWYDDCMLRYSNRDILHKMETKPNTCLVNVNNASEMELLNQTRAGLFRTLTGQALGKTKGSLSSVPYFAAGKANATGGDMTVYGMVQCTPDLTASDCSDCLDKATRALIDTDCSYGKLGGRFLMPSCGVRYETAPFFNLTKATPNHTSPSAPLPHTPNATKTTTRENSKKSKTSKVVISVVVISTFALITFLYCCFRKKKSWKKKRTEGGMLTVDSLHYDFGTVKAATNNFSSSNRLGQGGFGAVYKGVLPDGQEIAVKRLASNNSGQGEAEFKNEILLLAKLQHRNLVRLLGFCLDKEERLLIYEFVANASLDNFLFDQEKSEFLDWEKRTKIIAGISRGVLYLHEDSRLRIIHRDLKASNILLDTEMNPKIADFGLAKLVLADQTHADTSRIAGTYGYMAPEYALHGLFSVKADVYSFGILLLEIICGRRNNVPNTQQNAPNLLSLVWRNWREGTVLNVVDRTLIEGDSPGSEIARYIHIALLCVQEDEHDRPTMSSVVLMLSTNSLSLALPSNPGFVFTTTAPRDYSDNQSNSRSTGTSSMNKHSTSDLDPR